MNKNRLAPFRLFLFRKGLRPTSIKSNIHHVSLYLDSKRDAESFIMDLAEKNKSSYLNSIIASLRNYGHFIGDEGLQQIQYFKRQESEKAILSDQEIEAFLALTPNSNLNKTGRASFAKMTMFWMCVAFSGARCGEIASLKVNDCDFGRNILLVDGKTGKRNIPISPVLCEPLKTYIKHIDRELLFQSSRKEKPIDRATWAWEFQQRIKRLGIKRNRLSPHSLRHSFITRMLDEDVNLFKVQKIVGHRNIASTAIYTHLTTKDLQRTIIKDRLGRKSISPEEVIKSVKQAIMEVCADDPRFRFEITDKGVELMFKIEFLGEKP